MRTIHKTAIALGLFLGALGLSLMAQGQGGAFLPLADYTVAGKWTFSNAVGPVMTAPTISGTVAGTYTLGGTPTLTSPTINGYTITGTGTIANGATITTPALSGTLSGTFTIPSTATISGSTVTGVALSSGNYTGTPAVQSSASLGGSPVTLTAAQCGQAFAMDVNTGVVYIMPATFPTAGCTYDFYVTVSVTSNSHEIETGSGSHFFGGAPFMIAAAATLATGQCNGSSHIAYKTNGTTTGGLIGTHIKVTVLSSTLAWLDGVNAGSGSLATACSASN